MGSVLSAVLGAAIILAGPRGGAARTEAEVACLMRSTAVLSVLTWTIRLGSAVCDLRVVIFMASSDAIARRMTKRP